MNPGFAPVASPPVVLTRYLRSDEKLLWWGRPRRGIRLRMADFVVIPFSLVWAGFAVLWEYTAVNAFLRVPAGSGPPGFTVALPLFGAVFVAVGLYFLVGRFFVDAWARSKSYYAVTNERAMIVSGVRVRSLRSLPLATLAEMSLHEKSDGSGTIRFGATLVQPRATPSGRFGTIHVVEPPAFELIDRAREVHDLILAARAGEPRSF